MNFVTLEYFKSLQTLVARIAVVLRTAVEEAGAVHTEVVVAAAVHTAVQVVVRTVAALVAAARIVALEGVVVRIVAAAAWKTVAFRIHPAASGVAAAQVHIALRSHQNFLAD